MAAHLVVTEAVAAEHEITRVTDSLLRRAFAVKQCGQRHEGFERRARRVCPGTGPIEQRLVRGTVKLAPALRVDAIDEQIGVEAGFADKSQDAAGRGVDGDQCAASVAESVVGHLLQFCIEVEHQVVARHRRRARQCAHCPSTGIDLDFFDAGGAVQEFFVTLLQPGLADVITAAIVGQPFVLFELLDFTLVDAADVADDM